MEVRIGVVYTPKELTLEVDGSVDDTCRPRRPGAVGERRRCCGSPTRRAVGRRADPTSSPTSRSTRTTARSGSGSAGRYGGHRSEPRRRRSPRPPPPVLHRQGRCRQEHRHRRDRAARRRARQARAARRGRRQGQPHRALRAPAGRASTRSRCTPASTRCRCAPRPRCKEYLKLNLRVPGPRAPRAARVDARVRRHRRTRGQGDPHRRQGVLGGAGVDRGPGRLGPRHRRRRRHRPRRRASSTRRAAIRELVQVGSVREQTDWMAELLADPAITALNVVTTPEEMPVNETIELVETARRPSSTSRSASSS